MNTSYIVLTVLFWVFLFILFYAYLGYGIMLLILVKVKELFKKKVRIALPEDDKLPSVTLFITAFNEEDVVHDKMTNCLNLDYPEDKLDLVWCTDGSDDSTNALLAKYKRVRVLYEPIRNGKTAAMNRGMRYVDTEIVIFTDANTMVNKEAIRVIVQRFMEPKVGCVAGEKRIVNNNTDNAAGGGEGIYWKYESALKAYDDRLYSAVGAAGELFAVRRNLFFEMDKDTLLDDFILSLSIAMKGYKIAYTPDAYAEESGSADMFEEEKRKVRIAAGGLQSVWRLRPLLNPFKYGVLSFQYVSHRVLRWTLAPVILFLLFPINLILAFSPTWSIMYFVFLLCQVLFYTLGVAGYIMAKKRIKNKILFVPYYFLFMNWNCIRAIPYLYKKKKQGTGAWEKSKRA